MLTFSKTKRKPERQNKPPKLSPTSDASEGTSDVENMVKRILAAAPVGVGFPLTWIKAQPAQVVIATFVRFTTLTLGCQGRHAHHPSAGASRKNVGQLLRRTT
jgi:hypothetical protein